jgi:hypothetical protein
VALISIRALAVSFIGIIELRAPMISLERKSNVLTAEVLPGLLEWIGGGRPQFFGIA